MYLESIDWQSIDPTHQIQIAILIKHEKYYRSSYLYDSVRSKYLDTTSVRALIEYFSFKQ